MTDLQKNQAIYQAMCEIAEKYFNRVIENSQKFREYMAEKYIISVKELDKDNNWLSAKNDITFDDEIIVVDTFSCKFSGDNIFRLMSQFKSLAKAKGDYLFTYEEELPNEYIGSVDIAFDNPGTAKKLANHVKSDKDLCPTLGHVLLDVDTYTCNVNIVASNGKVISIISNDARGITECQRSMDSNFQALFSTAGWKRICDYARTMKVAVTFEIYRRTENEFQDTMIAVLGDARVKSASINMRYPNWRGALQKTADKHFVIHPLDAKAAQKFVHSLKVSNDYEKEHQTVNVSFYRGSDRVYFDYFDHDYGTTKTASFRLTRPSSQTLGLNLRIHHLQQIKFFGFQVQSSAHSAIIDCEDFDYMLVMPVFREEGYVFNVEEREFVEVLDDAVMVA